MVTHSAHTTGATRFKLDGACETCSARDLAVCRDLNDGELDRLSCSAQGLNAPAHVVLFAAADPADYFFTVTSGVLVLYESLPDGRRQVLDFPHPGDFIGIAFGTHYRVTAETLTATTLCRFPRASFERLLSEMPALEHGMLRRTADKLYAAREQMLLLGRKNAAERVASFLLQMAQRQFLRRDEAVHLPMTRADIADSLGLTTETVSRTFTRLRTQKLIEVSGTDHIRLLQPQTLKEIASGEPGA